MKDLNKNCPSAGLAILKYLGREAVQLENGRLRVTVLKEGGHLAEILHKKSGVTLG
jgi:hypothetical protein